VRALDALEVARDATPRRPPGRALDLACGRGRHALLLAARGYRVDAVDFALPALATLRHTAAARGVAIDCVVADVERWPLPTARYDAVSGVEFLARALFPALRAAVRPGGALVYETHRRIDDPDAPPAIRPEFLLAPGELEDLCHGWDVLLRADTPASHHGVSTVRAGIVAQRPARAPH